MDSNKPNPDDLLRQLRAMLSGEATNDKDAALVRTAAGGAQELLDAMREVYETCGKQADTAAHDAVQQMVRCAIDMAEAARQARGDDHEKHMMFRDTLASVLRMAITGVAAVMKVECPSLNEGKLLDGLSVSFSMQSLMMFLQCVDNNGHKGKWDDGLPPYSRN